MTQEPQYVERVEVRRSSSTGWWIAALVAIVAIVGLVFMMTMNNGTQAALNDARDQGAAEQTLVNATQDAQQAAASATAAAQNAADSTARATEAAAQSAAAQTAAAARSAQDAVQDTTTTEPAPVN